MRKGWDELPQDEQKATETAMLMRRRISPPTSPRSHFSGFSYPLVAGSTRCQYFSNVIAVLLAVVGISYAAFLVSILIGWEGPSSSLDYAELMAAHKEFLAYPRNDSIASNLYNITLQPHVAGTKQDFDTAEYVALKLREYGIQGVHFVDFPVLLSYPINRTLTINKPFKRTLGLQEGVVKEDPYSANPEVVPTFHGYSPSGTVTAEVVYANYGRTEDFALLIKMGVNCTGKIALTRYGKIFRGSKGTNAALVGFIGVLVYNDPEDFAPEGEDRTYPKTQWLPPTGTQRGSIFSYAGDPETPGWPSKPGGERQSISDPNTHMPPIPSQPISFVDATPILDALRGQVAPPDWKGGAPNVSVRYLGPGPVEVTLSLKINQTVTPIRDVIGVIRGSSEPDRYVILGNHRDAWTFGAADPNSGTASLLEVAKALGQMYAKGWRPLRTIVFCSWDAEEYALIGSTEWVEDNAAMLGNRAVAYLNVDVAVCGAGFEAAATPQLDSLIRQLASKVEDPDSPNNSLLDSWTAASHVKKGLPVEQFSRLGGGGSDFAPFLQHIGIAASDISFGSGYPTYHSVFDNFNWMAKFGDPGFHRHVAIARLWGLLALRLADEPLLSFNYSGYAAELQAYSVDVKATLDGISNRLSNNTAVPSVAPLLAAVVKFAEAAKAVERELNDRLMLTERAFIDTDGLAGRPWYKHLVYAPAKDDDYGSTAFPGIKDAIIAAGLGSDVNISIKATVTIHHSQTSGIQHEIWRAARVIDQATKTLRGDLV